MSKIYKLQPQSKIKILIFGAEKDEFGFYHHILSSCIKESPYDVELANNNPNDHQDKVYDICLFDISGEIGSTIEDFIKFQKSNPFLPKIVITDFQDESVGLKAIQSGAQDYLVKELINSFTLHKAIQYSIERSKTEKRLRDSYQAIESFAHTAAHDLKNPITTIQGFADALLDETSGDLKDKLTYIQSSAKRMDTLINDLLAFATLGKASLKIEKIDLFNLINEISSDLNCKDFIDLDPLPKIEGASTQIRQLFQNLISNSIKFKSNERDPNIEIYAKPLPGNNSYIIIFLKDNGIGIPENDIPKIFGAFYRISNKYEGTGIGLATCKKIIDLHHGRIRVNSKLNIGTTFQITLPLKQFQ